MENETALMKISGGRWDGSVFEIQVDPDTHEPPQLFNVSDDGLLLLDPTSNKEIGHVYGSNTSGHQFLAPEAAETTDGQGD